MYGVQQIKLKRKEAVIEDAVILKTLWDSAINSFPWSTKNQVCRAGTRARIERKESSVLAVALYGPRPVATTEYFLSPACV